MNGVLTILDLRLSVSIWRDTLLVALGFFTLSKLPSGEVNR